MTTIYSDSFDKDGPDWQYIGEAKDFSFTPDFAKTMWISPKKEVPYVSFTWGKEYKAYSPATVTLVTTVSYKGTITHCETSMVEDDFNHQGTKAMTVFRQRLAIEFEKTDFQHLVLQEFDKRIASNAMIFHQTNEYDYSKPMIQINTKIGDEFYTTYSKYGNLTNNPPLATKPIKKSLADASYELPGVQETVKFPCDKHDHCKDMLHRDGANLHAAIMYLNDRCGWTREEIADWIESLDIDTTFKTPTKENDNEQG